MLALTKLFYVLILASRSFWQFITYPYRHIKMPQGVAEWCTVFLMFVGTFISFYWCTFWFFVTNFSIFFTTWYATPFVISLFGWTLYTYPLVIAIIHIVILSYVMLVYASATRTAVRFVEWMALHVPRLFWKTWKMFFLMAWSTAWLVWAGIFLGFSPVFFIFGMPIKNFVRVMFITLFAAFVPWLAFVWQAAPRGDPVFQARSEPIPYSRLQVTAGARPKRRANLNNRGTGGKSKNKKDPQPPDGAPPAPPDQEPPATASGLQHTRRFHANPHPGTRTLFRALPADYRDYDCAGSPYCGFVAVDTAINVPIDRKRYERFFTSEDPLDCGLDETVGAYAAYCGVNLKIVKEVNGQDVIVYDSALNAEFLNVYLRHVEVNNIGHYLLITAPDSDYTFDPVVPTQARSVPLWHIAILRFAPRELHRFASLDMGVLRLNRTVTHLGHVASGSNRDVRPNGHKVDKIRSQESLEEYLLEETLEFIGEACWRHVDRVVASSVLYNEVASEAASMRAMDINPLKALIALGNRRFINCNHLSKSVEGTEKLFRFLVFSESSLSTIRPVQALNFPPQTVVTHDADLLVAAQQGLVGAGNKVISIPNRMDSKLRKPVADAPIGAPVTSLGQLGPGAFVLTEPQTCLQAFAHRSMTAAPKDEETVAQFLAFARPFLREMADSTPVHQLDDDCVASFRRNQAGKQTQASIERTVREYEAHLKGQHLRKFEQHSAFVKFENSGKMAGDRLGTKPRLIMVMSPKMKVECSGAIDLIHMWNKGPFGRFQVKDVEPEEMIRRIIEASDKPHCVIDYSSFESSINEAFRSLELEVLDRLAERAGAPMLRSYIRKHGRFKRVLKTHGGSFSISTRCSGDYWTSFGNGIVNVAVMAFCGGTDIRMLAEGDDGLVPFEVPNREVITRLGLKFSSDMNGTSPGDCDFLSSRWIAGKRFLNVAKTMNMFWVRTPVRLNYNKQMFILRCMALSIYWLSPGHPILSAAVERILRETRSYTKFRNYEAYLDRWKNLKHTNINSREVNIRVDESMRAVMAAGTAEFPPISIAQQLAIERSLREDPLPTLSNALNEYPIAKLYAKSLEQPQPNPDDSANALVDLFRVLTRKEGTTTHGG